MSQSRRTFLRTAAVGGGALAGGALFGDPFYGGPLYGTYRDLPDVPAASRALSILILGGTGFTGPYQVRYAVARGHRVTVFNRGRTETELPPQVEQLTGDRNEGEVEALRGRSWDVVVDNPTTLPFWVRDVGEVLHDATGQFVFTSTLSVYDMTGVTQVDESTPVLEYTEGDYLDVTPQVYQQEGGRLYGPMKAASEREAKRWFGDRTTVIRPGLIVGPRDQTDRFTYWPVRIARGGEVLAPGDGKDPVQVVDARDLAEWTIRTVEEGTTGVFNATGPRSRLTMAEQLHGIRAALPGDLADLRFTWVPADFLQEHGVRPWAHMTTWFGHRAALGDVDVSRAVAAGLTYRPLAVTAADTLEWFRALPAERRNAPRAGLDAGTEAAVLRAWAERAG
jgi:2'-hydroxyisoflavone reductase